MSDPKQPSIDQLQQLNLIRRSQDLANIGSDAQHSHHGGDHHSGGGSGGGGGGEGGEGGAAAGGGESVFNLDAQLVATLNQLFAREGGFGAEQLNGPSESLFPFKFFSVFAFMNLESMFQAMSLKGIGGIDKIVAPEKISGSTLGRTGGMGR